LLIREYFPHRFVHVEVVDTVDLGESAAPAGTGRPFDLESVAGELRKIEVRLEREGMYDFAALLAHRRERDERSVGDEAGFLGELASRRRGKIPVGSDEALGDRPGALVLARPKGAARMSEQYFKVELAAKDQKPRTDLALSCHG